MINEPISLEKKPKDFQPNSSFHRIAQNAACLWLPPQQRDWVL